MSIDNVEIRERHRVLRIRQSINEKRKETSQLGETRVAMPSSEPDKGILGENERRNAYTKRVVSEKCD